MGLNLRNSVTGSDIPIQAFQKFLYKSLLKVWPIDDSNFDGYGRVYKNTNDKGVVPEWFVASTEPNNTQYQAVYFDKDRLRGLFFFSAEDSATYREGSETIKVSLIFMTNLLLLKSQIPHRGDEEVRNDVMSICDKNLWNFVLTGTETGYSNVFRQFTGLNNKDGQVFEDRHPFFCLKLNFELFYQPTKINCN